MSTVTKKPAPTVAPTAFRFSRSPADLRALRKMVRESNPTREEALAFLKRAGVSDKSPVPTKIVIGKDGFYTAAR